MAVTGWIRQYGSEPWKYPDWVTWTTRMLDSYKHWTGESLLSREVEVAPAKQLFVAPFAVLAHNTAADPIFCYGNQTALDLWEVDLETLLLMPSRLSAEVDHRTDRSHMLHRGLEHGFISDYGGVRISSSGVRFRITGATIWNVLDDRRSKRIGQAATFSSWEFLG